MKKKKSYNPQIVKILMQTNKYWTGNYIFENEWQSFRTKINPKIEFASTQYEYKNSGKYKNNGESS